MVDLYITVPRLFKSRADCGEWRRFVPTLIFRWYYYHFLSLFQEGGPPPWVAFGRKTKDIDTSKSAFGVGGGGGADENDGKEGSQEKNVDFEKQRDEALQVS